MAKDKKSFILYADQKESFDQLPDEIAGKLIKHIFAYVNDEDPVNDDLLINVAFMPIKQQLKRDLKSYEAKKVQRSDAGKASAEARRVKKEQEEAANNQRKSTTVETVENNPTKSTGNVNGNVNVNDINSSSRVVKNSSTTVFKLTDLKDEMLNSHSWRESLCRTFLKDGIDNTKLGGLIEKFIIELETDGVEHKHITDAKKHCKNWIRKRIEINKPNNGKYDLPSHLENQREKITKYLDWLPEDFVRSELNALKVNGEPNSLLLKKYKAENKTV